MPTHVYANSNEIASKSADGKAVAAFPDVCFSPPAPPVGPLPLPYPNTGEVKDTDNGTAKVFIKDKTVGMEDASYISKSTGDEPATQNQGKGIITGALQGKCYFQAWSMDVKMEGKGVPRHLDMTSHNHASMPGQTICVNKDNTSPKKSVETRAWNITCTGNDHRDNPVPGAAVYEVVCDKSIVPFNIYKDVVKITENPKCTLVKFNGKVIGKSDGGYIVEPKVTLLQIPTDFFQALLVLMKYKYNGRSIYKRHSLDIDGVPSSIIAYPGDHLEFNATIPGTAKQTKVSVSGKDKDSPVRPADIGKASTDAVARIFGKGQVMPEVWGLAETKKSKCGMSGETVSSTQKTALTSAGNINGTTQSSTKTTSEKFSLVRAFPDGKTEYPLDSSILKDLYKVLEALEYIFDAVKKFKWGFFIEFELKALTGLKISVQTGFVEIKKPLPKVQQYAKVIISGTILSITASVGFGVQAGPIKAYAFIRIKFTFTADFENTWPTPSSSYKSKLGAVIKVSPGIGVAVEAGEKIKCEVGAKWEMKITAEMKVDFASSGVSPLLSLKGKTDKLKLYIEVQFWLYSYDGTYETPIGNTTFLDAQLPKQSSSGSAGS